MIIEHLISYLYQVKGFLEGGERTLATYPIDEIIKSLKEGKELEKYKQMWGELGIKLNRIDEVGFQEHYRISNVLIAMESLNNKYFPDPIKKTITFTIEAPTAGHLGTAINDFEMFWASYNEDIGHCIKYRYGEE